MSETTSTAASAQPAVKKLRRGVSNQTQAVSQLRFHEKDAAQNGLFIGHLESVNVDWSQNDEAKVFTGMKVPRLTFHFASNHANKSEQRHVYQTLFPVESNVDTIPGGKDEWKVNQIMNWIKHMLDIYYLKNRALTELEENNLSLPFEDFDENGQYVAVDPEVVLNGYAAIFQTAAAMLNGSYEDENNKPSGKPVYYDDNGKYLPVWMKLLRHKKRKDNWINVTQNGELGFDSFIGNGVIELFKTNTPPTILRLDLAKESIVPKETKREPSIGIPGMAPMGGVSVGGGMPVGSPIDTSAFNDAGTEMPF